MLFNILWRKTLNAYSTPLEVGWTVSFFFFLARGLCCTNVWTLLPVSWKNIASLCYIVSLPWECTNQLWASEHLRLSSYKQKRLCELTDFEVSDFDPLAPVLWPLVANHGGSLGQNKTFHRMGRNWEGGPSHNLLSQTSLLRFLSSQSYARE